MVIKTKKKIGKLASLVVVASIVLTSGVAISSERVNLQKERHIYSSIYAEWHVYPGESIQDAIDNASAGDTIYVHTGTYVENVDVNKRLSLVGDGMDKVTVKAKDTGDHTFHLTADGVTMSGFTVMNSYLCGCGGICIEKAKNCQIYDNKCTKNLCAGIFLINADHCKIRDNIVSNNDCGGIKLKSSNHNTVTSNTVENNLNWGINLYGGSNNNLIYNNYFAGKAERNLVEDHGDNQWNIEKTSGENIVDGPYLGGNYYDIYEGSDSDGDGIGDTPYQIPGGSNVDHLPLVLFSGNPPNKPSRPNGPTSGKTGTPYTYSTSTTDPDGDRVKYGWDWNGDMAVDEWTSYYKSGEAVGTSHKWDEQGSYEIRVKAQDEEGLESEWSDPLPVTMPKDKNGGNSIISLLYRLLSRIPTNVNLPPPIPKVTGPTEGYAGVEYTFCAVANFGCAWVDYQFDWDADGSHDYSPWYDNKGNHYGSGEPCCKLHSWDSAGTYCVKARSRPPCGHISDWSDSHYIVISKKENEPPRIDIIKPQKALYINNRMIIPFFATIIIGDIEIEVEASDESGINRVDFYVDNTLKETDTAAPYSWRWDEIAFFKHSIKVVAYDNAGNYADAERNVWIFNF